MAKLNRKYSRISFQLLRDSLLILSLAVTEMMIIYKLWAEWFSCLALGMRLIKFATNQRGIE